MTKPNDTGPENGHEILIDNKPIRFSEANISGAKLKELAGVDAESYDVWQDVPGEQDDLLIGDADIVDLTQPGAERFFTGKKTTTEG